jgi:Tfp pilus assembly protein PilX
MKQYVAPMQNESGVALITGLVVLVLLTALGTYAINVTQIEHSLSANLKTAKQAFYVADAGLAWGTQHVRASPVVPLVLANSTQALEPGNFTVTFQITPPLPAFSYTVALQSVGTVGPASKTLQAVVTKTYDLADAAITIRGNEADSSFTGNSFAIDGRDYDHLTGALTGGAMQYGITVPTAARQTDVNNALAANQKDNVIGTPVPGLTASIGVSPSLPSTTVSTLGDALCNTAPLANRKTTTLNGSYSPPANATWGTRASPQIYCVTGVGTPGNMSMDVTGSFSGVGVLVVQNADLVFTGNLHFEGLIIVTGAKVGFGFLGGGNKELYGAVIVNETDQDGPSYREDVIQGTSSLRYSRSALDLARQLMPAATVSSIITTLPATVQRVSWSEVNPN